MLRHEAARRSGLQACDWHCSTPYSHTSRLPCLCVRDDVGLRCRLHTDTDIKRIALFRSDCPSVCRLSVSHVRGSVSTRRKEPRARSRFSPHSGAIKLHNADEERRKRGDYWISASTTVCLARHLSWELSVRVNFPWRSSELQLQEDGERRWAASVLGDTTNSVNGVSLSVWVCYPNNKGMLWERWGLIAQPFYERDSQRGWITLPLCLRCRPQEKWARRKSPWQLAALERQTARSLCHFIACCFTPAPRRGRLWNRAALHARVFGGSESGMNGGTSDGPRVPLNPTFVHNLNLEEFS